MLDLLIIHLRPHIQYVQRHPNRRGGRIPEDKYGIIRVPLDGQEKNEEVSPDFQSKTGRMKFRSKLMMHRVVLAC